MTEQTLLITTTDKPIKDELASTSSTDMFFEGGTKNPVGRDVATHPFFDILFGGNFKNISHGNGGFSYQYGIVNDGLYKGGKGNGWNGIEPVDCNKHNGELCTIFTLDGKNLDFYWSHNELRKRMAAKGYIIANIYKAPIDDLFTQIDSLVNTQNLIYIQMGEEGDPSYWSPEDYARKFLEWTDEVKTKYPTQKFRFGLDIPNLYNGGNKTKQWVSGIMKVIGVFDKRNWFIRQYFHLYQFVEITGDLQNDLAEIENAMTTVLPAFERAIDDSPFAGARVFIGQVSANEGAYTPDVVKGFFYLAACYARITKFWIESVQNGKTKFIGQCFIGMNQWIGKALKPNLDFEFVSVQNLLYTHNLKSFIVEGLESEIDMYGGRDGDGNYRMVIQNRSAAEWTLPKTISFDARISEYTVKSYAGRYCESNTSSFSTPYTQENGILKPYSVNFFELKPLQ